MNVENYTIAVSHAISSSRVSRAIAQNLMEGSLISHTDGRAIKSWPSPTRVGGVDQGPNRTLDIFTVAELLEVRIIVVNGCCKLAFILYGAQVVTLA